MDKKPSISELEAMWWWLNDNSSAKLYYIYNQKLKEISDQLEQLVAGVDGDVMKNVKNIKDYTELSEKIAKSMALLVPLVSNGITGKENIDTKKLIFAEDLAAKIMGSHE